MIRWFRFWMAAWLFVGFLGLFLARGVFAAPGNDNFTNRFAIEGSSAVLGGSFVGATSEPGEQSALRGSGPSLWWSWKPLEDGLAVIRPTVLSRAVGSILITTGTDFASMYLPEAFLREAAFHRGYTAFPARAGQTYQIVLFWNSFNSASFELELSMMPGPAILEHPKTQTVSVGEGALFLTAVGTMAEEALEYEWRFNGSAVPNERGPTLALTNVTAGQEGEYQAIVTATDFMGVSTSLTSSVARLSVTLVPTQPVLTIRRDSTKAGSFLLDVSGDAGRSYLIQSKTNFGAKPGTAYGFSAAAFPLTVPFFVGRGRQEIYSASVYRPASPACHLNLRRIYFAKRELGNGRRTGDPVSPQEIHRFLRVDQLECPEGGIYFYSAIDQYPGCSLAGMSGHYLEGQ
jgi:hypothetical protein